MGWGVHRVSAADSDVLRVDVTNSGKIASLKYILSILRSVLF